VDINIYKIVKNTKTLGPGNRYAIWTQGCINNCLDCIAPDSQKINVNNRIDIQSILDDIKKFDGRGITISGGEPFLQIIELTSLIEGIQSINKKLDIIIYTGYTMNKLIEMNNEYIFKILNMVDIIIDGRYIKDLNIGTPLRGSSNQNFNILSEKGDKLYLDIQNINKREIEIDVNNNEVFLIGIPTKKQLNIFDNILLNIEGRDSYEWKKK